MNPMDAAMMKDLKHKMTFYHRKGIIALDEIISKYRNHMGLLVVNDEQRWMISMIHRIITIECYNENRW